MRPQMSRMVPEALLVRTTCCLLLLPAFLQATPLVKVKKDAADAAAGPISIEPVQAHSFLSHSRPRRNVEPKWYQKDPDFQSYYRYYNSIGHIEGLYEIDKLRMLYQQMRHQDQLHGSNYQNILGVVTTTMPPTTAAPPTTTEPPPPPTTPPLPEDPLADAQMIYLCNPKDPLCKPQIVYLPAGAIPVLCDPRYNPACRPRTEEEMKFMAPPPPPKKSLPPPPPPPVATVKDMEYDCDPYWDPDCLIDHPPRPPVKTAPPPEESDEEEEEQEEEEVKEEEAKAKEPAPVAPVNHKSSYPYFDPYNYSRDLFDPFSYANPAPDPE